MEKENKDYEPFGDEWVTEMKKWNKESLIQLLRTKLIEIQQAKNIVVKPGVSGSLPYDTLVTIGEAVVFMQGYKGTCTKDGEWSDWDEGVLKKLTDIVIKGNDR